MDRAAQDVANGTGAFLIDSWIPIILDPLTWIILFGSWATVETLKQMRYIWSQPEDDRRFVLRAVAIFVTSSFAYVGYDMYSLMPTPILPAMTLGVLSPIIYKINSAVLDQFTFTRNVMNAIKPHRRNALEENDHVSSTD